MKLLLSLFAVSLLMAPGAARADEYAHVDPEVLARGIERLAEAWTIPVTVFIGATDDFAKAPPFVASDGQKAGAGVPLHETSVYTDLENALAGLFSEDELALVLGEVGRLRRLD
ncbi:MAG: hypothetical protein ACR2RA_15740 [Geminicoccaceae bacterium]